MTSKNVAKKALLIGINYVGTSSELNGCINDLENIQKYLDDNNYMKKDDCILMNDNLKGDNYPSKESILKQLQVLVSFANSAENKDREVQIFVSYSGHGSHVKDYSGDERDEKDEVICPADYSVNGFINDDVIKANFIDKLHRKVNLIMLMDCCHSGTSADLRYRYKGRYAPTKTYQNKKNSKSKCQVVVISGCTDKQYSSDAYIQDTNTSEYEFQGAMTASFLNCISDKISYRNLIRKMRLWLRSNDYEQIPQISSGKRIKLNTPYLLYKFKS